MRIILLKKSIKYFLKLINKNLITYVFAISPTVFLLFVLVYLFPYTGLERIIALPAIIFINSTIILIVMAKSHVLIKHIKIMTWMITIFFTMFLSIAMYPQESDLPVIKQIDNSIITIKEYDRITLKELELINSLEHKSIDNQSAEDRYVVALYKFKDQIPLDGSYHLYQQEVSYFFDTTIKSIDEISDKLIGHHKVIWWYLNACNY